VVTEIHVHTGKVGRVIPFGFKDAHGTAHLAVSPDDKTLYAFGADPARTVTTVTPINLVTGKASPPVRGRRRSCSPRTARRRTS
jgi:hypothetical protein